jgi:mycofactocin system creatininase family protein
VTSSTQLAELTSTDMADGSRRLLLLPLGSCEQHGAHLPLDTDTRIAAAIAAAVATGRSDLVVAPAQSFGASGEHQGFAGTVSIGSEALHLLIIELARSLGPEFGGLALLSWHGGNIDAIGQALAQLRAEGHNVVVITPTASAGGDAHAGRTETSIMLALAPDAVRLEQARPGDTRPLAEIMPLLRRGGLKEVTESGILGDPAGASAAEGMQLLAALIASAQEQVERWAGAET